jgi:hypothetical protein
VAVDLLDRIAAANHSGTAGGENRSSADQYFAEYIAPQLFGYGGSQYSLGLNTTYGETAPRRSPGRCPATRRR